MGREIASRAKTQLVAASIGALGELPGGSIVAAMLNASLARSAEEKTLRLLTKLEERVLRAEHDIKEPKDPAAFSAVFNAVLLETSRTYSNEKIDLLGGLLANSFGWEPADWQLNQRPLDTLIAMSEAELRVLVFVSDPQAWMKNNDVALELTPFGMSYSEFVLKTLCKDDPRLHEDVLFSIEALTSKLLIGLVGTDTQMTSEGLFASRTAPLGDRVLELGRTTTVS